MYLWFSFYHIFKCFAVQAGVNKNTFLLFLIALKNSNFHFLSHQIKLFWSKIGWFEDLNIKIHYKSHFFSQLSYRWLLQHLFSSHVVSEGFLFTWDRDAKKVLLSTPEFRTKFYLGHFDIFISHLYIVKCFEAQDLILFIL